MGSHDLRHIAGAAFPFGSSPNDCQVFQCLNTDNAQRRVQTYTRPRSASMLGVICVSGGGGGGGGRGSTAGSARGGGGGGGSGGAAIALVPAFLLPSTLFVAVGQGGAGGAGGSSGDGSAGSSGTLSSLIAYADPSGGGTGVPWNVVLSGNGGTQGGGGNGGTNTGAATGGAAANAFGTSSALFSGIALWQAMAGTAGASGGTAGNNPGGSYSIQASGALFLCAGAGGASCTSADQVGGSCSTTGTTGWWLRDRIPAAPAAGTFDGSAGPTIWQPFYSFGGYGGSSSNSTAGGNGGPGGFGSGGGGGGAGVTTGGRGGDGGPGIVIIYAW